MTTASLITKREPACDNSSTQPFDGRPDGFQSVLRILNQRLPGFRCLGHLLQVSWHETSLGVGVNE
jgi:hypothetical protein